MATALHIQTTCYFSSQIPSYEVMLMSWQGYGARIFIQWLIYLSRQLKQEVLAGALKVYFSDMHSEKGIRSWLE